MKYGGVVRFQGPQPNLSDATVRVQLLDTSRADRSSKKLAEQTIHGASLEPEDAGNSLRFGFDGPEPPAGRSYSLTAHVDLSGSGEVDVGDYITMESVPVEPRAGDPQLEIPVRQVHS